MSVDRNCEHIHLEHDGKLLLVDIEGNGPAIPKKGRTDWENQGRSGASIVSDSGSMTMS